MARLRGCLRFAGVGLGLIIWPVCGSFGCPGVRVGAGCFAPVVGPGLIDWVGLAPVDWAGRVVGSVGRVGLAPDHAPIKAKRAGFVVLSPIESGQKPIPGP